MKLLVSHQTPASKCMYTHYFVCHLKLHIIYVALSHLRSKESTGIRTSCQGYILMYTGVHLDVTWEKILPLNSLIYPLIDKLVHH